VNGGGSRGVEGGTEGGEGAERNLQRPTLRCTSMASGQGLTLVHFPAYHEHFCGLRWMVSWSFGDQNGSG